MTISKKQLEANKKNAPKGGVKTQEGKAIVKYNALKHGLLACFHINFWMTSCYRYTNQKKIDCFSYRQFHILE